jgi:protoporphyrinogen oxidase
MVLIMKVAILGGGLTGLAVGYFLKKRGIDFDILEKECECGGLMRSISEGGFTFDCGGSHIIFSKDAEALAFMLKMLGKNIVRNRRNTKILYKGRLVKYPFENGLADLEKDENLECVRLFMKNLEEKEKGLVPKPKNLKQWFYYTFGKGISEKYLIPYNEKIWKYDLEKTSTEWVERIPNPPAEDIMKSSAGIETEGYTHQLHFFYPREGGIESLINSIVKEVEKNITRNFEVRKIRKRGKRWIVSGKEELAYDKIISTIPIHCLVNSLDVPKKVIGAAEKLKYNSLITVMLGVKKLKINDLSWLYIPDKDVITHRVSFPSGYSPANAPKGCSSILAEITCNFGDSVWNASEKEIINRVVNDLHRLKIIEVGDVCFSKAMKMKYAYVINDIDYRKNNEIVENYMKTLGIGLAGRFSEFKYLNMDNCIRSAMDFVESGFVK